MEPIECEGASVSNAVEAALKKCGLRRDQVEIFVLDEGTPGFLGIGAKLARVRVTKKHWGPDSPVPPAASPSSPPLRRSAPPKSPMKPRAKSVPAPQPERQHVRTQSAPKVEKKYERPARPEPRPLTEQEVLAACRDAHDLVDELLRLMSIASPAVSSVWDSQMERIKLVVESQDASVLIQHGGRTLEALQFIATLMLSRGRDVPVAVQVDALSFWEKREQAVLDQARSAVESVKATGKPVRLEPMESSMRRLIHRTYKAHPDISTVSEGEGPWRKLVIRTRAA